ncbi:peptidylprolyl isomerase [Marininema halotolerans]|uniref:Foldase protein PrsA n=1 Tax=Marininema halotolerans TaxID=1155944 RepID=A0A1I6TC87_9BACL|nr:peptidylprolyl isomerase [Marininema halotolerans]SFS86637.1 foldase protein PrsA [Marininema halotolerans]
MQPIKKGLLAAFCVVFAVSLLVAGCGSKDDKADKKENPMAGQMKPLPTDSKKIVAEYNGGKVQEGDFNLYLNIYRFLQPQAAAMMNSPEAKKGIIKQYVAERKIVKEVKDNAKYGKEADKSLKQFEEQLKQMAAQDKKKKKQDIDSVLKEGGITKAQLRSFLVDNNKVSDYFESQVKESDLKKEYDKSDAFDKVKLNHVLVAFQPQEKDGKKAKKRSDADAKKLAEEVKKKLEKGESFKDVAKKYSDDPGSKDNAGEIEDSPKNWVPAFGKAAKTLPLNKISDPIKTEYGYHVLKVNKRSKDPFSKVKEEIKGQHVQKLYEKYIKDEVKIEKMDLDDKKKK